MSFSNYPPAPECIHEVDLGDSYLFSRNQGEERHRDDLEALRHYINAAAMGLPLADAILGFCYEFGIGGPIDYIKAETAYFLAAKSGVAMAMISLFSFYKYGRPQVVMNAEAAEEWKGKLASSEETADAALAWLHKATRMFRHPTAYIVLASCYLDGLLVSLDRRKAFAYFMKSAESGYGRGQASVAWCYSEGIGVPQNEYLSFSWYLKAAHNRYDMALIAVGRCYQYGRGVPKDEQEAFKWFLTCARMDNAYAMNIVGSCYECGIGIPVNGKEALRYYLMGSEQGHPVALFNVGRCFVTGISTDPDTEEAIKFFMRAARLGNIDAQLAIASHLYSTGIERHKGEAMKWYQEAASHGSIQACSELGLCLLNDGQDGDSLTKALRWLTKAAESDHIPSKAALAKCYILAMERTSEHDRLAFTWAQLAAEQNDVHGMFLLGYCYEMGIGVLADPNASMHWYKLSANRGSKEGRDKIVQTMRASMLV